MTSVFTRERLRKTAVGNRYVENSASTARTGDPRSNARALGNPASAITPSGGRFVAAYAATAVPSDRPRKTSGRAPVGSVSAYATTASASRYSPDSVGVPLLRP